MVELLLSPQLVLKIVDHKLELVASLVRLSDFNSPLVLVGQDILLDVHSREGSRSRVGAPALVLLHGSGARILLQQIRYFHALLVALKQVSGVVFVELTEPIDDLVLAWQIDLIEGLLHLGLHLGHLHVRFLNSLVL